MRRYQEPDKIARVDAPITSKVGYLVKRVQAALRVRMEEELRAVGLSVSQYAILEALLDDERSEATNAAIARRCFITPQSASEMITKMTESDLVSRRTRPNSRIGFELTKRGRTKCIEARRRVIDIELRMLAGVTAADRTRLADLLKRCSATLENGEAWKEAPTKKRQPTD